MGFRDVSNGDQSYSEPQPGPTVLRAATNRFTKMLNGPAVLLSLKIGRPEIVMDLRIVGLARERGLEMLDGPGLLILERQEHP